MTHDELAKATALGLQMELRTDLAEKPLLTHREDSTELLLVMKKGGKQFLVTVEEIVQCACGAIDWKFEEEKMEWNCLQCGNRS